MEITHHLVLWIVVACHLICSPQQGKNIPATHNANTVSFVLRNDRTTKSMSPRNFIHLNLLPKNLISHPKTRHRAQFIGGILIRRRQ